MHAGPMASLTPGNDLAFSRQGVSGISATSHVVEYESGMFTPARSTLVLDTQSHECSGLIGIETMTRSQRMSGLKKEKEFEDEISSRQTQQSCTSSTPSLGLKTGMVYQYTADLGNEWMDDVAIAVQQTQEALDQPLFPVEMPLRRAQSQPLLSRSTPLLMIPTDFEISMKEVEEQRMQINEAKKADQKAAEQSGIWTVTSVDMSVSEPPRATPLSLLHLKGMSTTTVSSLGASSIGATRLRTQKKSKGGHPPRISKATRGRMKYCITALQQPSVRRDRRASCPSLKAFVKQKEFPKKQQRVAAQPGHLIRTTSVILGANCFDAWMTSSSSSETNPYMWAQLKWDKWFDELYADENHGGRLRGGSAGPSSFQELVNLKPQSDGKNREMMQLLQNEAIRLTDLIDVSSESTAFHLCRRGAIYRKMGRLKDAMDDLSRAIELEPEQLDAYWHRHLLYLLQKNDKAAMADLSFIIKRNRNHSKAYKSLGQLFEKQGDFTMAVANYSQAISLQPDDGETYYRRAQLFEKKNDLQLALEDYAMASKLMVDKTDAVFKHGKYNFDSGFWVAAVSDFTSMIEQDPGNSLARTYRGRAYAKQGEYQKALVDLSAALHLDPSNSVAFCHRGCLLRKENPHKALEDLSISLLIDNSVNNVMAYLHRGIVYTDLKKFDEAIPDFQTCIQLDKSIPCAHTSLGLVLMQHLSQYQRAVQCFSNAIKANPTYVRGYVCRGDAYSKLEKLDDAIRDYTKAIHLRPDAPQYHLYRGNLLLKKGQLGLAAAHVRHAAELNKASLGSSATQQAVVQTFLHNYQEAIDIIESAPGSSWNASLFVLKGKTCLKAKKYNDATENFTQALELVATSVPLEQLKCSRAEVHFLIGQCYSELQLHDQALASYNAALKRDPTIAQVNTDNSVQTMGCLLSPYFTGLLPTWTCQIQAKTTKICK
jgi:tetratricopeptide (TPR) repeat protein